MLNSPICVDASVVIRLVQSTRPESPVVALWREWRRLGRPLVAPTLLYYEVSNSLHRYAGRGEMTREEAHKALDLALRLRLTLFGDAELHRRALDWAGRLNLPASYDAHYLALAELFGAELWTDDRRLVHVASSAVSWVHELAEVF